MVAAIAEQDLLWGAARDTCVGEAQRCGRWVGRERVATEADSQRRDDVVGCAAGILIDVEAQKRRPIALAGRVGGDGVKREVARQPGRRCRPVHAMTLRMLVSRISVAPSVRRSGSSRATSLRSTAALTA